MFNPKTIPKFKKKQTREKVVFVEIALSVQIGELTCFFLSFHMAGFKGLDHVPPLSPLQPVSEEEAIQILADPPLPPVTFTLRDYVDHSETLRKLVLLGKSEWPTGTFWVYSLFLFLFKLAFSIFIKVHKYEQKSNSVKRLQVKNYSLLHPSWLCIPFPRSIYLTFIALSVCI